MTRINIQAAVPIQRLLRELRKWKCSDKVSEDKNEDNDGTNENKNETRMRAGMRISV